LLNKMLAKKPADRHQSYAELIAGLRACAAAIQSGAGVPSASKSRRLIRVTVAAAAMAAVAVMVSLWFPWRQPPTKAGGASAPRPTSPQSAIRIPQSALDQLPAADVLKIAYSGQPPAPPADAPRPQLKLELLAKRKGALSFTPIKDGDPLVSESDDYLVRAEALAPGHLYVFQVDSTGNKTWLYPRNETSPFSSGANPLAAGQKVQVPSAEQGRALFLDRNTGIEHIYAVFCAARWPELETALAQRPTITRSALSTLDSRLSTPLNLSTRGIGGLRPAEPSQPLTADGPLLVIERWFKHVAPE
jgi:hypothetical protein